MNIINNIGSVLMNEEVHDFALRATSLTCLASICGYAGTFFFSKFNPKSGAIYLASVALTSQVAYEILEKLKESVESPRLKQVITAVQLLQIPMAFYLLPDLLKLHLSGGAKLEIIVVTAHFVAIPVFFHLAIKAWNEPTLANVAAAVGVMLSLANGLRSYIAA